MAVRVQVARELGTPEASHGSRWTTNKKDVPGGSAAPSLGGGAGGGGRGFP